ncbi:MAG: hypothetical protein JNK64_21145 [Myxococcales bacterium]|nr:hypothetical protein [Myxococcales bacterium]
MRRALACLTLLAAASAATPARANGRFPRSQKLVFQPGHPQTALAGLTFGAFLTKDDGATWRWICEAAVGFEGTFDPDYELTASGAMFATTPHGLRISRDGCAWTPPAGDVGTTQVTSIAVGGDGAVYTGTSDVVAGSAIYKSTDDGVTFTPTTLVGAAGDWWSSIEVAPSAPQRLLVTGYRMAGGMPRERLLFRSADGGVTWDELPTAALVGTDAADLLIAAIDPSNPDVVFLRITATGPTIGEALYRSADVWTTAPGGPTWTKVLEQPDRISAVLARAGGEVVAATPTFGMFRSTDGGQTFTPIPDIRFDTRCLVERPGGDLWMCTNNVPPDSATLHRSTAGAAGPWTPALAFADLTGPVRCAAGTPQHDTCEAMWCGLKENFAIRSDEISCGGAVDAGVDAAGGGGGGKGCCSTSARPGAEVGLVALALLGRRRRRQRPGRVSR